MSTSLVPVLALADGPSSFTCPRLSGHLQTGRPGRSNIALADERPARVEIMPETSRPGYVSSGT